MMKFWAQTSNPKSYRGKQTWASGKQNLSRLPLPMAVYVVAVKNMLQRFKNSDIYKHIYYGQLREPDLKSS